MCVHVDVYMIEKGKPQAWDQHPGFIQSPSLCLDQIEEKSLFSCFSHQPATVLPTVSLPPVFAVDENRVMLSCNNLGFCGITRTCTV